MCDEDENESRKISTESVSSHQAVPDADKELATIAFQEFEMGNYEQCLNSLNKLLSKRQQDTKVFHNICVTEYYISGCKKTEIFNKNLIEICKQAHIDIQDIEVLEDVDNCVILYNQAVVLYHLHQYNSAINILDKIFQYIEPLDEVLAKNIGFLFLELCLCVYQPKKTLCLIAYMESGLSAGSKNSGRQNQKERDNQKEDNSDNCISETLKRRLQLCKARCYAMIKTSKACKREIKNLMSSGSVVQNIPAFYLKSQLEYQRGNYRKALKLLNSVTLPEDISKYFRETGDCLRAIFFNNVGCIHFYMGKPHLGQFYMDKAIQAFDSEIKLVTDNTESKLNSRPLHLMSISTRYQLVYNLGMMYLQAQKFKEAFSCFIEVVQAYSSNPRLWLRIAECCIHNHKPDNTDQFIECKHKSFVKALVGAGPHRKLIMNSASDKLVFEDSKLNDASNIETPSLHFAMICLKNALFLLPENHSLNNTGETLSDMQNPSEETEANGSEENNTLPTLPSNFIQGAEILSLRNSILIASSYVALCLGDVLLAHEYAKTLLSQPRISGAHKFLAHLYAGESLLLMDRITEAVEHLNFQYTSDIELAFPASSSENSLKHQMRFDSKLTEKNDDGSRPVGNIPNWFPNTISSAKFISQYNLAVAYALREEWSKALECLVQMNPNGSVPSQALSLLIYVQCHQGIIDDTKTHLKRCISSGNV
ncbi:CCR4-NOT transcription complex subunit 10-like [Stegodyphus dumicola]|uniref:CCR4-NOT transcription complex subunit 10-like n=1 Tax=Stegodyphus dumicola TaxID=202533 RepID=UPI0015AC71C2|nr:CCR4-NOT transcription complex subunit 10-like [Stegodyphus dumicola]XP_035231474.1 CCR4-NOT transcription complex subunit 10-like [Stegodyphus dumicola]XP_035231481.1 CCR4-NOT transcription complex subunit 10-like [Stegodyphus dumicola]XP_035231486.1 CCR4-NOT transcription complex subunit 10-like [Stegodyphus dumicola]XP_035231493.1 CCR4-NOT transcription complex subunit 10-like [Stegodyphus dumicola]